MIERTDTPYLEVRDYLHLPLAELVEQPSFREGTMLAISRIFSADPARLHDLVEFVDGLYAQDADVCDLASAFVDRHRYSKPFDRQRW